MEGENFAVVKISTSALGRLEVSHENAALYVNISVSQMFKHYSPISVENSNSRLESSYSLLCFPLKKISCFVAAMK